MKNLTLIFLFLLLFASSCHNPGNRNLDIATDDVVMDAVKIKRYEKALFSIPPDSLQAGLKAIAAQFPVFLGVDLDDTLNIIQLRQFITDPLNRMLYDSSFAKYPDLKNYEEALTQAFKRFKYYFPQKDVPDVFTYVSGLLYEMPVQFFNDDMIIALDMYLGKSLEAYRKMRLPLYEIEKMNKDYLVRDGIYEFYYYNFLEKPGKDFLQLMINKGKHLYFLDALLPETPDYIKIGFPAEKLEWCRINESNIWSFIIENELLYSSDSNTTRMFFVDGPFTSDFSGDSPARIGEWIGWQVVRAYMDKNPEVSMQDLMEETDSQKILKLSGYKPHQ